MTKVSKLVKEAIEDIEFNGTKLRYNHDTKKYDKVSEEIGYVVWYSNLENGDDDNKTQEEIELNQRGYRVSEVFPTFKEAFASMKEIAKDAMLACWDEYSEAWEDEHWMEDINPSDQDKFNFMKQDLKLNAGAGIATFKDENTMQWEVITTDEASSREEND